MNNPKITDSQTASGQTAESATYQDGRIVIKLTNGKQLEFRPQDLQGLGGADAQQLSNIEIYPGGRTVNWPDLNECFTVDGLLAGITGSKRWMAAQVKVNLQLELIRQETFQYFVICTSGVQQEYRRSETGQWEQQQAGLWRVLEETAALENAYQVWLRKNKVLQPGQVDSGFGDSRGGFVCS